MNRRHLRRMMRRKTCRLPVKMICRKTCRGSTGSTDRSPVQGFMSSLHQHEIPKCPCWSESFEVRDIKTLTFGKHSVHTATLQCNFCEREFMHALRCMGEECRFCAAE